MHPPSFLANATCFWSQRPKKRATVMKGSGDAVRYRVGVATDGIGKKRQLTRLTRQSSETSRVIGKPDYSRLFSTSWGKSFNIHELMSFLLLCMPFSFYDEKKFNF